MAQKSQSSKPAQAAAGSPSSPAKSTTTSGKAAAKGRRRRGRSNSNRTLIWLIIGGVIVVFAGIVLLNWQSLFGAPVVSSPRVSEGTTWGPASAPVKVVEYSNFGCSHCKAFAEKNGKTLREEYEAGGKVRFEFMPFKLGDPSTTDAANAALCAADQSRFWDYHDVLFAQQGKMAAPFTKANLKQYGAQLGLDASKFNTCVDKDQYVGTVNSASDSGQSQGVEGTPTFIINGQKLVGDVPYTELKAAVDAAVQKVG